MRSALPAFLLLLAAPLIAIQQPGATIISYHQVLSPLEATAAPAEGVKYTISLAEFGAQLDYLQRNGYHVIPLADLVDYVKGKTDSLPPKAVVITVDDGWRCTYTDIYPEMQRRQMPFTAFIFPALIGKGRDYLTWPEVEEMSKAGVDIEDHTYTHSSLEQPPGTTANAYAEFLRHELQDSRTEIERHTQKPVRFIAYPYSVYDAAVEQATQQYGYDAALYDREYGALIGRGTPLMHLKRFPVEHGTTLEDFKRFLP